MARATKLKREEDPALPKAKPVRKVNLSLVPIAEGVRSSHKGVQAPKRAPSTVTNLSQIQRKTRYDFKSETEYELYLMYQQIQAKERENAIALLSELSDAVGTVEVPTPDLNPQPAAAASPVVLDQSEELAAYLAHWNPMGSTRHIPTVEGYVMLKDGTQIKVHKRQDLLDRDENGKVIDYLPYGGYQSDGLCFKLSEDRALDRRSAMHLTRRSQNSREKLGKVGKTAYQNLVMIKDYRPVPDVDWFLKNPDGKSFLRGDLNPYPVGITPLGKEAEAQYIKDKTAHTNLVNRWVYSTQFSGFKAKLAAAVMNAEPTEKQIRDHIRLDMMSHDRFDADLLEECVREWKKTVDDLPWADAANDSDPVTDSAQVSTPQGSDATEGTLDTGLSYAVLAKPTMEYLGKRDAYGYQWQKKHEDVERDAEEPQAAESVVFVRSDGISMKVDHVPPAHRTVIAEAISTAQPHAGIAKAEGEDGLTKISLDLTDRRAVSTLKIMERRLRADIAEMHEHLENVIQARWLAEAYRKTGTFEIQNVSEVLSDLDIELEVERVPTQSSSRDWAVDRHAVVNWRRRTIGFRRMIHHAEELERATAGRLRVWMRADEQRRQEQAARDKAELAALKRHKRGLIRTAQVERAALRQLGAMQRGKAALRLHEHITRMKALEHHLGRVRALIPEEVEYLYTLGDRNPSHRWRVMMWKIKEFNRQTLGRMRTKLNLGHVKPKRAKLRAPTPSTVSETPVNTPSVTLLPARTPPAPATQVFEKPLVLVPEAKVWTFADDPVLQSIRRSHMMRLAKTGKIDPKELESHDNALFNKFVA